MSAAGALCAAAGPGEGGHPGGPARGGGPVSRDTAVRGYKVPKCARQCGAGDVGAHEE